ncbi:MAG: Rossmann-like and DUF2520 domain-containing protein [Pyrinomonadaceae bacterium]
MKKVSIVGVGRVGGALALSLPKDKYSVIELITRGGAPSIDLNVKVSSIEELSETGPDIVFITTQDYEIKDVDGVLADKLHNSVVFHTSGSYPSSVLAGLAKSGCKIGSIHPLVSISKPELGPERFRGSYFCVEGVSEAVELGKQIVTDLGGRSFSIDTRFKTLYHASAVTACGHLVALFDAAVEMMTKCGLSESESRDVLLPLVLSTVQNLQQQDTAAALTGTFARADAETFTRHLTALNEIEDGDGDEDLLEIYLLLGERSLELAAKQGVSAERIETLRSKVAVAKSKLKW